MLPQQKAVDAGMLVLDSVLVRGFGNITGIDSVRLPEKLPREPLVDEV